MDLLHINININWSINWFCIKHLFSDHKMGPRYVLEWLYDIIFGLLKISPPHWPFGEKSGRKITLSHPMFSILMTSIIYFIFIHHFHFTNCLFIVVVSFYQWKLSSNPLNNGEMWFFSPLGWNFFSRLCSNKSWKSSSMKLYCKFI